MKYFISIFLFLICFQNLFAQKSSDVELNSLRKQLDTAKTLNFDKALEINRKGYFLSQKANSQKDLVFFANALGSVFHFKSEMDSSLHYYLIAFKYYEKQNDTTKLGVVLNQIAKVHRKLNNTEKALHYYDLLLQLQVKARNQEGIAIALNESGIVFEQMGNFQEAQKRYRKSLVIQRERNDSTGIGYSLKFIGYNYLLQKKWKESEKHLLESLMYFEATDDSFAKCLNYSYLGQLYSKMQQLQKSNVYIEKSLAIARAINYADIEIENLQVLIQNSESLGNFQQALQLQKKLMNLRDSLYDIEKIKNVEDINEKYQTEKKERQILIQQNEIEINELNLQSRNHWIFGLSILSILVMVIGFLIYKDQRMRIVQQRKENALKLEVQRIEGENLLQEQRLNISRDLHDNIGSQLTFVISSVDTLKFVVGNKDGKVSDRLTMVSSFVKDTIVELRDTIWAMNQHHIGIDDLKIRISNFIESATRSVPNIHFSFQNEVSENLKPEYDSKVGMNIYRIIQEAVNNSVKHGQATAIGVKITAVNQQIIFEVFDNGIGFNVAADSLGNGLSSMQKRAQEIGAEFRLSSNENGTKVVFSIPHTPNLETT